VPKAKKEKKAGVKTVVGLTFEELVMDKTKGVEHVTLLATESSSTAALQSD
jgi:hypothetical protein